MKTNLPSLTNEEKINFLAELKELCEEGGWFKSKDSNSGIKVASIISGILTSAYIASLIVLPNFIAIYSFIYAITNLLTWVCPFSIRKHENTYLLNASNGKIDRKTYFELVKSNEIEKWQTKFAEHVQNKYLEKKQIQVEEYIAETIQNAVVDMNIDNPNLTYEEIEKIIKTSVKNTSNKLEK